MINDSEYAEHLRIELLDPRWQKQRQVALERTGGRDSNVIQDGDVIGQQLQQFTRERDELLHGTADKEKKPAVIRWDGRVESINAVTKDAYVKSSTRSPNQATSHKRVIGVHLPPQNNK